MKSLKKILASALACVMALSTASVVFAAGEITTTGDGSVLDADNKLKNPIYSVSLPTTATDVAVNALSAGDVTGSQIYSAAYTVVNKSSVPVLVKVRAAVVPADPDAVTVATKPSQVVTDDTGHTGKEVYVEAVALPVAPAAWDKATALSPTFKAVTATTGVGSEGYVAYTAENGASTKAKKVLPAGADAGTDATKLTTEVMAFALGAASDADATDTVFVADALATGSLITGGTANTAGYAAFRLMGSASTYSNWAANDFAVQMVFNVAGLPSDMYTKLGTNSAKYNESGKETNMVETHMEKFQIKKSDGTVINNIEFTATDGVYAAPTGLTVASTKSNITVTGIASVELVDGTGTVPSGNGMNYVPTTKGLTVMPTWVTLATAPLKNNNQVEVKINFNYTVEGSEDVQSDYITVTLSKAAANP